MKNFFRISITIAIAGLLFSSCSSSSDYDYSFGSFGYAYGTVVTQYEETSSDYGILLDDGSNMVILHNEVSGVMVENGQRVRAYFYLYGVNESESGKDVYYVNLAGLDLIISKPPVNQSDLDEGVDVTEEDLGEDALWVKKSTFSGRYLNVWFDFLGTAQPPAKHFVNVVYDDVEVEDGKAVLTMRHNGYGDVPTDEKNSGFVVYPGMFSFDISSLVPEEGGEIEVVLKWHEYGDKENEGWWNERIEKKNVGTFEYYPNGKNEIDKETEASIRTQFVR